MNRRQFLASQFVVAGGAALALGNMTGTAIGQTSSTVVAIPVTKANGVSDAEFRAAVRTFLDYIRKAPGFQEGMFLKPTFQGLPFDFLDVMRWRASEDWENLFAKPEFVDLIGSSKAFTIKTAEMFVPERI